LTARLAAAPRPAPPRQDEEAPARPEAEAAQDIRIAALRRQVVAAALRGIEEAIQRVRPAPAEGPARRALRAQDLAAGAATRARPAHGGGGAGGRAGAPAGCRCPADPGPTVRTRRAAPGACPGGSVSAGASGAACRAGT